MSAKLINQNPLSLKPHPQPHPEQSLLQRDISALISPQVPNKRAKSKVRRHFGFPGDSSRAITKKKVVVCRLAGFLLENITRGGGGGGGGGVKQNIEKIWGGDWIACDSAPFRGVWGHAPPEKIWFVGPLRLILIQSGPIWGVKSQSYFQLL